MTSMSQMYWKKSVLLTECVNLLAFVEFAEKIQLNIQKKRKENFENIF